VPPKQPIPSDRRTSNCVSPRPVIRQEHDRTEPNRNPASVVEDPPKDMPPQMGALAPDELAALHAFFALLSQWDESPKGEIEHE
jgi:hypothetical protein